MILIFSIWLKILPSSGYVNPFENFAESLRHLIMPSFMLGVISAAFLARLTRSSLLEVMAEDYIRTARAKGLSERIVIYKHALKNALIPVVTAAGMQFALLLGGAVVAETIFLIPGMGRLVYISVLNRDYPLLQGCILIVILFMVIINLIVDVVYTILDPRVKLR
jgi:peptide/nickel transport system permease protein